MPNRIVRANILTSEAVNSLTIEAELAYRRLLSVADDFGLYDGRATIVRSYAFPLRQDAFSVEVVERCLDEMDGAKLIHRYQVEGKPYLEILKFNQRTRAKLAKYPMPPSSMRVIRQSDEGQLTVTRPSSAHGDGDGDGNGDGDGSQSRVSQFIERYPKKTNRHLACQTWLSIVKAEEEAKVLAGLERWIASEDWSKDEGKFVHSAVTFLQNRLWLDYPKPAKATESATPYFDEEAYA